ncbi:MAG: HEAT repeat domain-containing protein, partial [Planctomycetota bacterium]
NKRLRAISVLKMIGEEAKEALPILSKLRDDKEEKICIEAKQLYEDLLHPLHENPPKIILERLLVSDLDWIKNQTRKLGVELQKQLIPFLQKTLQSKGKGIHLKVVSILNEFHSELYQEILDIVFEIAQNPDLEATTAVLALKNKLLGPLHLNSSKMIAERLLSSEYDLLKEEVFFLEKTQKQELANTLIKILLKQGTNISITSVVQILERISQETKESLPILSSLYKKEILNLQHKIYGPLMFNSPEIILKRVLSEEFPLVREEISLLDPELQKQLVPLLIEALTSSQEVICLRAINSLSEIGKLSITAIPALVRLRQADHQEISEASLKLSYFLKRIQEIWEEVPVLSLNEGIQQNLIQLQASNPQSYQSIELSLENLNDKKISVDLAGSYLVPKGIDCQPLALGPTVFPKDSISTGSGNVLIQLLPKEKRKLRVSTCCLESGKAAPSKQNFALSSKKLPKVRETVMRWWADHPYVPQGAVNSAIWQNRDTVQFSSLTNRPTRIRWNGQEFIDNPLPAPTKLSASLYNGTYYQLSNLDLLALEPDGRHHFLGTEILQVIPSKEVVYAVAFGETLGPELWRLAMTGENPWSFVTGLNFDEQIDFIFPGTNRELLLVTKSGLHLVEPQHSTIRKILQVSEENHLSLYQQDPFNFIIALFYPMKKFNEYGGDQRSRSAYSELWSLNLLQKRVELLEQFWNISDAYAGIGGVFALSHNKKLKRLVGKDFKDLDSKQKYEKILVVGSKIIWAVSQANKLIAVHMSTGQPYFSTKLDPSNIPKFYLDPVSDDLAFIMNDEYWKLSIQEKNLIQVKEPE